jgi:hypothetical protein
MAVLVSRPLALARASLELDLMGPPAADESWASFEATVLDNGQPDTAGVPNVQVPVRLGGLNWTNDTLVGYWTQGSGAGTDFTTFYSVAATAAQGGVKPAAANPVPVTAGAASPVPLTLLLDPRGAVKATSGILPVTTIRIPPDQYAAALANLSLSVFVAPVLSGSAAGLAMPLPAETNGTWSWVSVANGAWAPAAVTDSTGNDAALAATPQTIVEGWLHVQASASPAQPPAKTPAPPAKS